MSPRPDRYSEHDMLVGANIARERLDYEYTQEGLASHLGWGLQRYRAIEQGKRSARVFELMQLAEALGCSVTAFFWNGKR